MRCAAAMTVVVGVSLGCLSPAMAFGDNHGGMHGGGMHGGRLHGGGMHAGGVQGGGIGAGAAGTGPGSSGGMRSAAAPGMTPAAPMAGQMATHMRGRGGLGRGARGRAAANTPASTQAFSAAVGAATAAQQSSSQNGAANAANAAALGSYSSSSSSLASPQSTTANSAATGGMVPPAPVAPNQPAANIVPNTNLTTLSGGGPGAAPSTTIGGAAEQSLAQCMSYWSADTDMTRTEWRQTCHRTLNGLDLASGGQAAFAQAGASQGSSTRTATASIRGRRTRHANRAVTYSSR